MAHTKLHITKVAMAAICCLWVGAASAESGDRVTARELMAKGLEAQENDDLVGARAAYLKSFEAHPSFDVAGNLGLVEIELRQYPSAANHLAYCLRHFPTGESQDLKELVQQNLAEARKYAGAVTFTVADPRTNITIDGHEALGAGSTEHEVFVGEGEHTVVGELHGRKVVVTFRVPPGAATTVELNLRAESVANGAAGPNAWNGEEPNPLAEDLGARTSSHPTLVPVYLLGGIGVSTLATSFSFRSLAQRKQRGIEEMRPTDTSACAESYTADCAQLNNELRDQRTLTGVSNATLVVGAVAATAAIGYLTYALTRREPRVQTGVAVHDGGGAMTLGGAF